MGVPSTKQKQHRQREIVRRVKFRRVKLYGLTAQSAESAHRQFLSKLLSMLSEWANLWGWKCGRQINEIFEIASVNRSHLIVSRLRFLGVRRCSLLPTPHKIFSLILLSYPPIDRSHCSNATDSNSTATLGKSEGKFVNSHAMSGTAKKKRTHTHTLIAVVEIALQSSTFAEPVKISVFRVLYILKHERCRHKQNFTSACDD